MTAIKKLDHIVITTPQAERCIAFYEKLGFASRDAGGRYELFAGDFKINVHIIGSELSPKAANVCAGSADVCFEIDGDIEKFKAQLEEQNIIPEQGIVARHGVRGDMRSVYLRDPDGNLLEFSSYE
ncbi:MAG: VOC family protein [Christensenella sp.]